MQASVGTLEGADIPKDGTSGPAARKELIPRLVHNQPKRSIALYNFFGCVYSMGI
jgi:hypothetical protein